MTRFILAALTGAALLAVSAAIYPDTETAGDVDQTAQETQHVASTETLTIGD